MRVARDLFLTFLVLFLLPSLATLAWWEIKDRPASWREADWTATGVLPPADASDDAAIYVLAARTGGLKGAFSLHSWIVTKAEGAGRYSRYDKVGWGEPIRRDAYAPDARWYSNEPTIVHAVTGERAGALLPQVEAAIAAYPYSARGAYTIWPGPNSNSFVAHVVNAVPELGARMPPNATGRDYAPGLLAFHVSRGAGDLHLTAAGLAGLSIGLTSGIELHLLGLVAGIDIMRPALKIPAYGRLDLM